MRFNGIGLTALTAAVALTLGGCISVEVNAEDDMAWTDASADIEAWRADSEAALAAAGIMDGERRPSSCERYIEEVLPACLKDEVSTNAVLLWADRPPPAEWSAEQGIAGMPILLKDNIETADMPTTAGSLALVDNAPGRDAPLVARLREAGAVILGKTNLSEWANIRSTNSTSGWSAVGGLTRNPHALDRNACGSSSGSGAAVAAGLAPAAIGTETDGSITCPAAINGIVERGDAAEIGPDMLAGRALRREGRAGQPADGDQRSTENANPHAVHHARLGRSVQARQKLPLTPSRKIGPISRD